jgi:hypothetical protein
LTRVSVAALALAAPLGCSSSSGSPFPITVPDGGSDAPASASDAATSDATTTSDAASDASADAPPAVACATLTNPLYIMSGDTQVPILKALGKALRQDTTTPTTLVWFATGSCTIIDAVYNNTPLKQNLSYIPSDPSWDPNTGTVPTCTPAAAGVPVQLGIPIVFPESCTKATPPATVKATKGPVQPFVFVVPNASTAQAISAAEAYLTFGFGAAGMVSPWLDPTFYFVRPATKGTQVSLGAMIGVPAAKWKGQPIDQSTAVASMVAASSAPDKTIGILGAEIYDSAGNRAALRSLSFQGTFPGATQTSGYLPDTTASAFDKRNVRDGHYLGWSHVIYLTVVDANSIPTDVRAARVVDLLTGSPTVTLPAGLDPLALIAGKGLVPICAMNVERDAEGGPLTTYQSADPCGCAYEAAVGTAPGSCVTCTSAANCTGAQTCRHGYCEAADGRTALSDCATAPVNDAAIINNPCTARAVAPARPQPVLQMQNGGMLPPLP